MSNITDILLFNIQNQIPISFSKYGDGELYCMEGLNGTNCDYDKYTSKLGNALISSFRYMVEDAPNAYLGVWHTQQAKNKFEKFVKNSVKWAQYHTFILDRKEDEAKINLYKAIKNTNTKKIMICNPLLIKAKYLLNIDHMIHVPYQNWFDNEFENVLQQTKELIKDNEPHIVLTACGMSAKVLICELTKNFQNGIYLDIGSALDFYCTRRDSRGREYRYEYLVEIFKELTPQDWNDKKYDYIYTEARNKLGLHM
jgi:hypothetical protein